LENPARNALMLHKRASKSKGESSRSALGFTGKEKGRLNYLAFLYNKRMMD
jgi:hypothetical protein